MDRVNMVRYNMDRYNMVRYNMERDLERGNMDRDMERDNMGRYMDSQHVGRHEGFSTLKMQRLFHYRPKYVIFSPVKIPFFSNRRALWIKLNKFTIKNLTCNDVTTVCICYVLLILHLYFLSCPYSARTRYMARDNTDRDNMDRDKTTWKETTGTEITWSETTWKESTWKKTNRIYDGAEASLIRFSSEKWLGATYPVFCGRVGKKQNK